MPGDRARALAPSRPAATTACRAHTSQQVSASVASNIPSVWKCFPSVHAACTLRVLSCSPMLAPWMMECCAKNLCILATSGIASVCNAAVFHQAKERRLKHAAYPCTLHSHPITRRLTEVCACVHTYLCAYSRVSVLLQARRVESRGRRTRPVGSTSTWPRSHISAPSPTPPSLPPPHPHPHTHNPTMSVYKMLRGS